MLIENDLYNVMEDAQERKINVVGIPNLLKGDE